MICRRSQLTQKAEHLQTAPNCKNGGPNSNKNPPPQIDDGDNGRMDKWNGMEWNNIQWNGMEWEMEWTGMDESTAPQIHYSSV